MGSNRQPVCTHTIGFESQWGLHNQPNEGGKICLISPVTGKPLLNHEDNPKCVGAIKDIDINAPEAWSLQNPDANSEVVVGVIDSGINYRHPNFGAKEIAANHWIAGWDTPLWINPGEVPNPEASWTPIDVKENDGKGDGISDSWADGVDNDGNGYTDDIFGIWNSYPGTNPMSTYVEDTGGYLGSFHGTHVTGIIAANDGSAMQSVNRKNVKVVTCKHGKSIDELDPEEEEELFKFCNYSGVHRQPSTKFLTRD